MKIISILILLIDIVLANNSCNLKLLNFDVNRSINLTFHNKKDCKGYILNIEKKDGNIYNIYVNLTSKIINQAPPYGFSISNGDKFYSLGVDKHIRDSKINIKLLEDSKIDTTKYGFNINWHIYLKKINNLKKIIANNIEIEHMKKDKCKIVYLDYLTTPRRGKISITTKEFMKFCSKTWSIIDKNSMLIQLLKFNKNDIENQKYKVFLEGKENIKNSTNKNSCNIYIDLIDMNTLKPISSNDFIFLVDKINKESYEKEFRRDNFNLLKGIYSIKAVDNNYTGRSKIIDCRGEDYNVTIPLLPNI